eukprot:1951662-Prymnesium_polylepis.1
MEAATRSHRRRSHRSSRRRGSTSSARRASSLTRRGTSRHGFHAGGLPTTAWPILPRLAYRRRLPRAATY